MTSTLPTLRSLPFLAVLLAALSPCAAAAPDVYTDVRIDGIPHVKQKPDFCGEACVEMVLRKLGRTLTQDDVFIASGLDPAEGRGCFTRELAAAVRALDFDPGAVWHRIRAEQAPAEIEVCWRDLHEDLRRGVPSIVCTRYDASPAASEHFRLVVGYEARSDEVLYHEPAESDGAYRRMKRARLFELWPLKYKPEEWSVVRLRLEPRAVRAGTSAEARPLLRAVSRESFTPADFAQHVRGLRAKLPGPGFTVHIEPPFVVAGDEAPATVRRRAKDTIRWAVDHLKAAYFHRDPLHIVDIWLFKDKESYDRNTKALFGAAPHTPFGYYSSTHRALVMNISTGGGTLVHEIVHPFVEANFPGCPAWLNEGLASLYEQCDERRGKIWGLTNWRLEGLQRAIRSQGVPNFQTLASTTSDEFYGDERGVNYAQARYLCYYLQEKGLLARFWSEFRDGAKEDPGGYKTLVRVLDRKDMDTFQREWEAFVLKLSFP